MGYVQEKMYANMTMTSKDKGPWTPSLPMALSWSVQLFSALVFLHGVPLIHRDVKPSNVMVTRDMSLVKLVDLGLCTPSLQQRTDARKMSGKTGSYRYMAPEVMNESECYTDKVDVYSGTLVVWFIMMGQRPFENFNGHQVAEMAARQAMRPSLSVISHKCAGLASVLEEGWKASVNEGLGLVGFLEEDRKASVQSRGILAFDVLVMDILVFDVLVFDVLALSI